MEPITGAISPQRRQEIVDAFAQAEDGAVLVSQVQAGGTGLNIQSARVIIFCEPQIKPSIENQAISRAYRMGQVRDVLVYRLLADDTVDERIMEMLQDKQHQFDSFADDSVVGQESLKPGEADWIHKMVAEEKQRLLGEETA
jgi:SNF2 family DNA or RNA helicase